MLENLKQEVLQANLALPLHGLVTLTWGNVSGIDRKSGIIAIKPSGVLYENMQVDDIVLMNLNGDVIEGNLKPSSDAPTHIALYRAFENIGGIVHTHSSWATSFAQAGHSIPPLGTTHADSFYGEVPCSRAMTKDEINSNYEENTGHLIIETFKNIDPLHIPAVLVREHGPFTWGTNAQDALRNAIVLEEIAKTAFCTKTLAPDKTFMDIELLKKHFFRKHGKDATYGQN